MRAVSAFRRMSSDAMVLLGPLRERTQSCECGYIRSVKLCQEVFLRVKGMELALRPTHGRAVSPTQSKPLPDERNQSETNYAVTRLITR